MTSTAQIADFDRTPWQLYGGKVTYRLGYRLVDAAERLRMLGERVTGEGPETDEELYRSTYEHGYRMGLKAAVRALVGGEATR